MWSLITVSGPSSRDQILGRGWWVPAAPGAGAGNCVSDKFPYSQWRCAQQNSDQGREQSYLTRPTRFMMNNERSVFIKSPLIGLKEKSICSAFEEKKKPLPSCQDVIERPP